jgi:superoxide dismutase, Fe-Mn family
MKYQLPRLPFEMSALEPFISRITLEFHHGKHHKASITNLNNLISGTKFENTDLKTIIKVADGPVFYNAVEVWNHSFYFEALKPGNSNTLNGPFAEIINDSFGSVSIFKDTFMKAAGSLFGSGWVWLVRNPKGSLEITQESISGNPLRTGLIPLMTCDVWEHSYYLDYQNKKPDYVEAFWNLIDWELIEKRYIDSM